MRQRSLDEVVKDADGKKMIAEAGDGVLNNNINVVSTLLLTLTEASRGTNGIHWEPKVAPPCYLCETALKNDAAAPVVDAMEAAEDEFPSRMMTTTALSAWQSSNMMPTRLPLPKTGTQSPIAEEETAVALAAAPTDDKEEIDVDSLVGHWFHL
jgi:hypothetical protein